MKVAVNHIYSDDTWIDIVETDRLPDELRLKFDQAILVGLRELRLSVTDMQGPVYTAGGENQFPMMIMGKLNLIAE
jgi:hypothetical protein